MEAAWLKVSADVFALFAAVGAGWGKATRWAQKQALSVTDRLGSGGSAPAEAEEAIDESHLKATFWLNKVSRAT